jgi:hypothetical protein
MKIKRAVKSAAIKEQLEKVLEIARKANIRGLEIQEILPLVEDSSFEKRGKIIIEVFKKYPLTSLSFHSLLPERDFLDNISQCQKFDISSKEGSYILELTKNTIKEAAFVGKALEIKTEIPIIIHLFGFTKPAEITIEEKEKKLKLGEKRLLELKEIADYYSRESGLKLVITRENNPPEHGQVPGLLDFHPKDLVKTENKGIRTCLDFAHLWLNILYWRGGKGESSGVDLNKKIYPDINLEETINELAPSLAILHLNDAGPSYRKTNEGLEIGKGNLFHSLIIPLICSKLEKDIIGTYEMKYGHQDMETMFRSDQFYRKLFKEKFQDYFE